MDGRKIGTPQVKTYCGATDVLKMGQQWVFLSTGVGKHLVNRGRGGTVHVKLIGGDGEEVYNICCIII